MTPGATFDWRPDIVRVLKGSASPLRPAEVERLLLVHFNLKPPKDACYAVLHHLWLAGKIVKVGPVRYTTPRKALKRMLS